MNKLIVLAVVALLSPVAAFADESCTVHVDAVTHQEYKYQLQKDINPLGGHETWQNVGSKTDWTEDTEVDGHAADEKYDVPTRIGRLTINVTHRWHLTDERTVIDEEATEVPCETGGSSESNSGSTTSGGGGFTFCDLNTLPTSSIRDIAMCVDRESGKVVPELAWRGAGGAVIVVDIHAEQKKVLLLQAVELIQQMIQYLKTH